MTGPDVGISVGATDQGFSRLLQRLREELRRLGAEARALTRDQVQDARDAANAASAAQKKQIDAYRDTIQAGRDAVAQERSLAAERNTNARDQLRQARESARATADNARAAVQAARTQANELRQAARDGLSNVRAQNAAQAQAARELIAGARAQAQAQREAGRAAVTQAREAGAATTAEARRSLTAKREQALAQKAAGRELLQSSRDQARAEIDASRQILQANVQRTRQLREQFAQQIKDAKDAVIARQNALKEAQGAGGGTADARAALTTARGRLQSLRDTRDQTLGGANANTEQSRLDLDATKQAAREKVRASQEVVRAVNAEAQVQIRAAHAALTASKEASDQKIIAAKRASDATIAAANEEFRAAKQLFNEQAHTGKTGEAEAKRVLDLAQRTAQAKITAAKESEREAIRGADAEVNAAKRVLQQTVSAGTAKVREAERNAGAISKEQREILKLRQAESEEAKEKLRGLAATQRGIGVHQQNTLAMANEALGAQKLINYFQRLALATGAFQAIRAFVREGFEFNQTIETATLGIGALITAESRLFDVTGHEVKGRDALNLAMRISENQMLRLRIAGLQTAATTEELVKAMQQAVGPGLAAGGSIDQIRNFTVQLTQAAGAIGLPFFQLNEEVRSLLAGTINYNTRIAKSLGITNAMVREWKSQGVLFDRLNEKFAAFNTAGRRSMETFQTLKSNITEALQVFAGASTRPLFETLRKEGAKALNAIFDFDTGKISAKFLGIVRVLQDAFAGAGTLIGNLITNAIDGAQELSRWFDKHREQVQGVVAASMGVVEQFGQILLAIGKIVVGITKWGVETGTFERLLRITANILGVIADHMQVILAAWVGMKAVGFLANLGTLSTAGVLFGGILVAMQAIDAILPDLSQKFDKLTRSIDNMNQSIRQGTNDTITLVSEYEKLQRDNRRLAAVALKTGAKDENGDPIGTVTFRANRERQIAIVKQLMALNPGLVDGLKREEIGTKGMTEALRNLSRERGSHLQAVRDELAQQEAITQQRIKLKEDELAALGEPGAGQGGQQQRNRQIQTKAGELAALKQELLRVQKERAENDATLKEIIDRAQADQATLIPNRAEVGKKKTRGQQDDLRQAAEAAIKTIKSQREKTNDELDQMLAANLISYREYYGRLTQLDQEAIKTQIAVRRKQLAAETDVGRKNQIKGEITDLTNEFLTVEGNYKRIRIKKEQELQEDINKVVARAAEQQGVTASARFREVESELSQLRARLVAENTQQSKQGVEAIDRLVPIAYAKARLEDLEHLLSNAQRDLQLALENIDVRHIQGSITAEQQNTELNKLYSDRIQLLKDIIPEMEEFARLSGDETAKKRIQELNTELLKLEITQAEVANRAVLLGHAARAGLEETLGSLFKNLFQEGRTIKIALAELALGILQSMNDVLAPQIAQTLTKAIVSSMEDVGNSAAAGFVKSFISAIASGLQSAWNATLGPVFSTLMNGIGTGLNFIFQPGGGAGGAVAQAGAQTASSTVLSQLGGIADFADSVAPEATATAAATIQQTAATTQAAATAGFTAAVTAFSAAVAAFVAASTTSAVSGIAAGAIPDNFGFDFASGGVVPGTSPHPRADNIPIWATAGEMVHSVPSVRYYGEQVMQAINQRLIPRETMRAMLRASVSMPSIPTRNRTPRFADGGVVGATVTHAGGHTRIDLHVHSDDSHIVKVLGSKPGVRVQLENMRQNPNATRRVLSR
jgi:hypothetical protein